MKKVGIFGGSFNPIHKGHIEVAKYAMKNLKLEEVWFIPTNITPGKKRTNIISNQQRLQIIKESVKDIKAFKVKNYEIDNHNISYTIDTLNLLRKNYKNNEYYLLIGDDQFNKFLSWKDYQEIIKKSHVVVFNREGIKNKELIDKINPILLKNRKIDISSTKIRQGHFNLLDENTLNIINKQYLYIDSVAKNNLTDYRLEHTYEVAKLIKQFAIGNFSLWEKMKYKFNKKFLDKYYYTGMLHDITKDKDKKWHLNILKKYNYDSDIHDNLLHQVTGYLWSKEVYKIQDEISNAILYHTTANDRMKKIDMLLYIADKIAGEKNEERKHWIKNIALVNYKLAFKEILKNNYDYIRGKFGISGVDQNTINAYKKYIGDRYEK